MGAGKAVSDSLNNTLGKSVASIKQPVQVLKTISQSLRPLKVVEGMAENIKKVSSASTLANEFENAATDFHTTISYLVSDKRKGVKL